MDRIIEVKVNGGYLSTDSRKAGNQYEANITKLRLTFDHSWDGYAKTVIFRDAKGMNPVKRVLTTDLLENAERSTRVYLCPIPGEAMAESGMMSFTVTGYVDGVRQMALKAELEVEESDYEEEAGEAADPTPSQAEQLQTQIDAIIDTVHDATAAKVAAISASFEAKTSERNAQTWAEGGFLFPHNGEVAPIDPVVGAKGYADQAKGYADAARVHAENAQNASGGGNAGIPGGTSLPATQVYLVDGSTAEAKIAQLLNTYFNRTVGGNVEGPVSTMSWGTFSAGTNGVAVIAENAYIDKSDNTYRYQNTHNSLGARGIVMHPQYGVLWFDTGNVATTAGGAFNPDLRSLQAGKTAGITSGNMNDLVDTGFYNGNEMANAPGGGWYYIINIGHSHDPVLYRAQIAIPFQGPGMKYRVRYAGVWTGWQEFVTGYGGTINGLLNVIGNGAPLSLIGEDHVYLPMYRGGVGSVRSGYMGYGDKNDLNLTIHNEVAGGAINAVASGGFKINGQRIPISYIANTGPVAEYGSDGDIWYQHV